ncbi:hypothetical protein BHE74_00046381 [Ensete ventricosum]|nr:hypothetical protein BHE74_00046381 [Ensete ventricosum]
MILGGGGAEEPHVLTTEALAKSLLYFEAQRSGRLPYDHRVSWRGDSGLTDGLEQGVDLVGGYYDAGDNVKFGLPMAFTVTMLSWSVVEYGGDIAAAGELKHALAAIKWGTDYFIKAHTHPNVLWAQLFEFGDKHRGRYDDSIAAARRYYPSGSGYGDELLWAALWLHRASGREEYLDYVLDNAYSLNGAAGRDVREEKVSILEQYRAKAEHYLCSCLSMNDDDSGSNVARTPAGLLFVRRWNNMQYVAGAAFLLAVYSDYLADSGQLLHCPRGSSGSQDLLSLAKSQVDYVLGSNPRGISYLVGHGGRHPRRVHHRAASSVSYKVDRSFVGCTQGFDEWYGRGGDNPNDVVGAVVGGPDDKDEFSDVRGNYVQTEACTYNTAPMVGVLAKLATGLEEQQ